MSVGVGVKQWAKIERSLYPASSGYAARGAAGPGPAWSVGARSVNHFQPGPYSTVKPTTPQNTVRGSWVYDLPMREMELVGPLALINALQVQFRQPVVTVIDEVVRIRLHGRLTTGRLLVSLNNESAYILTAAEWAAQAAATSEFILDWQVTANHNPTIVTIGAVADEPLDVSLKSVSVEQQPYMRRYFLQQNPGLMSA